MVFIIKLIISAEFKPSEAVAVGTAGPWCGEGVPEGCVNNDACVCGLVCGGRLCVGRGN